MRFPKTFLVTVGLLTAALMATGSAQESPSAADDAFLWLEEVESDEALNWVEKHNSETMSQLASDPGYQPALDIVTHLLNAEDRIAYGSIKGDYVYNFWQDEEHVRGILRRTSLEEYLKASPEWETALDIDQLNRDEGQSWVYKGISYLPPDYDRGLVSLSPGGKDAVEVREFDLIYKKFIKDGFFLPEAKSNVDWYDANTLIIGTDFGEGSLTTSGYPRFVKLWQRGTGLDEARTLLEGDTSDVWTWGWCHHSTEGRTFIVERGVSFWESIHWLVDEELNLIQLPFPTDATIQEIFKNYVVVKLHSDWLGIAEGSVIAVKTTDLSADDIRSKIDVIFTPDETTTAEYVTVTKDYMIVSILENVSGKILYYVPPDTQTGNEWTSKEIALPGLATVGVFSTSAYTNNLMVWYEDFLNPTSVSLLSDPGGTPKEIKSLPARFDAGGFQVHQYQATSRDGTSIPYYVVAAKDLHLDGSNPTLLYGYGGFRSSLTPKYSGTIGQLWLEKGGTYVLANIRGGGEFGPRWHKAGLLENRQRCFDDFIAVAEDLIERKITSPKHLGIEGGSNGGLLVGAVFTQRPELFGAVVCQVPLLDMLRYHKLPPGASWMGEYGDPDIPEQRAYIAKYSPYQNLKKGVDYPDVLFVTSTKDDRVHPGHARKMAARMEEFGNKVHFWEETEGGHAAAADNKQRAKRIALEFTYLHRMLFTEPEGVQ
jgi:prolyl oligopeptidase